MSPPIQTAAIQLSALERGRVAAEKGDWEMAAEAYADALFLGESPKEARRLLREAAEKVLEARTQNIQKERQSVLVELGLLPPPPREERPPQEIKPPPPLKFGPPTPEKPIVRRRPRRPILAAKKEEEPAVPHAPSPADREMARFLYFQGLKFYAENELDEARSSWRRALDLDPGLERARLALENLARYTRK